VRSILSDRIEQDDRKFAATVIALGIILIGMMIWVILST
jgi:hypothetical protein